MGDRLTSDESDGQADNLSYGDIFDELFPHYLVMGMSPEEYWDGENSLKPAYRNLWAFRRTEPDTPQSLPFFRRPAGISV